MNGPLAGKHPLPFAIRVFGVGVRCLLCVWLCEWWILLAGWVATAPAATGHHRIGTSEDMRPLTVAATAVLALASATSATAATEWTPLVLAHTEDGYDNHDEKYPQPAECMMDGGQVKLRGHIQCKSGNQDCWGPSIVNFATLPLPCRPSSAVKSTPAGIDGCSQGCALASESVPSRA
jgi:hypothetical protein